jgi:lipoprotein signal peptidase
MKNKWLLPLILAAVALTADMISKQLVYAHFDPPPHTITEENPNGSRAQFQDRQIDVLTSESFNDDGSRRGTIQWLTLGMSINTGMIFGGFTEAGHEWEGRLLLLLLMSVAFAGVIWLLLRIPRERWVARAAVGLIFGGALGNMADRLFGYILYQGKWELLFPGVVDWIKNPNFVNLPLFGNEHWLIDTWPTYNVADASILCGLITLLAIMLFSKNRDLIPPRKKKKKSSEGAGSSSREAARAA